MVIKKKPGRKSAHFTPWEETGLPPEEIARIRRELAEEGDFKAYEPRLNVFRSMNFIVSGVYEEGTKAFFTMEREGLSKQFSCPVDGSGGELLMSQINTTFGTTF